MATSMARASRPFRNNVIVTGSASMKGAFVLAEERLDNVGYLTVGQMQSIPHRLSVRTPITTPQWRHVHTSFAKCREVEGGGES